MKNRKGFTLIELLAVIIILGVLMVIAVPAVTKYINDSRKSSYVSTAKSIASGVRNLIHSGALDLDDPDTTYYIDTGCIKTDNGSNKSPYGDFIKAYVVVTADYEGYEYFWTSVDETGIGVKGIINVDKLDTENIEEGVTSGDITTTRGLDNRSKVVVVNSSCQKGESTDRTGPKINSSTGEVIYAVCRAATSLHNTTICAKTNSYGCNAPGHVGNGNPITYGTIVDGTPKAGDAYDCDVNNDGTYDSATERFYYVKSDGANTILIYYANMNGHTKYMYDANNENWHGPTAAYQYLPSTSEWDNPGLITPGTRQIVADNGESSTSGGTIGTFTYTDKAARFLTYQELTSVCGTGSMSGSGYLDSCLWLMENVGNYEGNSGNYGYWLETPVYNHENDVFRTFGNGRTLAKGRANESGGYGVRPVITVKTTNIE